MELTRESVQKLAIATRTATYADILEPDENGGERLRENIDPFVERAIQDFEFGNGRLISIKLAGKARHRLATASSGKN